MLSQGLLVLIATLLCLPGFGHFERRGPDKSFEEIIKEIEENLRRRCSYGNGLKQHGEPILGGALWRELQLPDAVGSRKPYEKMLIVPIENNGPNYHEISSRGGSSWEQMGYRIYQTKVIGEDNRQLVTSDQVGMVLCTTYKDNGEPITVRGTGTVVGNRHTIVTVSHNFFEGDIYFDFKTECAFRQYDKNGNITFESYFNAGEFGEYIKDRSQNNEDWAVIILDKPLPATVTPMAYAEVRMDKLDYGSELSVEILAYQHDKIGSEERVFHSEGYVSKVNYRGYPRLAHTADTAGRASGGALIYTFSDGNKGIIGLHKAHSTAQKVNWAVPLSGELIKTLDQYINPASIGGK